SRDRRTGRTREESYEGAPYRPLSVVGEAKRDYNLCRSAGPRGSHIIFTMYPTFFRVGSFEVTSFGVMVAVGALVGLWVFGRELARSGLPAGGTDAAMAGVFGGLFGAKLLWVAEHLGEEPFRDLLFSRGGMSWFGGLLGGVGPAVIVIKWQRLPLVPTLAAATPALAIGHAIG